ncbi:hypothetical protein [Spirosoma flavum]|uniref:Uncharacterized protein n=1 Tax=Spirosoma flavum TaxID=2048557 RepID=A0ABW6ATG2_9BACT
MLLIFSTIDPYNQSHHYSWWFNTIETACDALSTVSLKKNQIVKAEILDNEQRTQLPPQAFDGVTISFALQQLEKQWQQILRKPLKIISEADQWLIDLTKQRIKAGQATLEQSCQMILQLETGRKRAKNLVCEKNRKAKFVTDYESMLSTYQAYVVKIKAQQKVALDRLTQLESA